VSLGVEPTPTPEPTPEPTLPPTPEPTPAPVVIPDVRNSTPEDAVNALLDLGLQPGERTDKFNANVVEGLVIRTSPVAGTEVQPGSTVDYVVSRGPNATPTPEPTPEPTAVPTPEPTAEPTAEPTPEPTPATVLVPDLRGFAEADAVNTLLDQGLQPGARSEAYDPDIAAGLVISTDPAATTEVDRGSTVDYVVSLGVEPSPTPEPTPALVTIPNLRGSNPDDAVNALLDLGLQPGERQDRFNANVPQGQVIRTIPDAGTEVSAGTTVDYRVSLGAELTPAPTPDPTPRRTPRPTAEPTVEPSTDLVTVPNLRGSTPDDAVNALLDAGLQPGSRSDRLNTNVEPGLVIRTNPAAGEQVARGTTVDYFVSREPQPSDGSSAAPTQEPSSAPSNNSGIDPDVQAAIDAVVAQVPALRELQPKKDVPYREITQRQFRREVTASFDAENPPAQVAAEENLLKRLGLLPQDADLRRMMLALYESQVAAYYDPKTGAMTIIKRDGTFGPEERVFVAHEYDHALQDQYWGLDTVTQVPASQGDRALAHLALVEGDATSLMLQWASQNLTSDELSQVTSAMTPADQELLDGMPEILRRQLEFPYVEGQVFVTTLLGQGGWDSVNGAWDNLPVSTEQILHPERYPSDTPVKVTLPDVAAALGAGWDRKYLQTMGELDINVLLADGGNGSDTAAAASDGWGGDRLVSLDGPNGSWAVVWQTTWDRSRDADEFSAAVDSAMSDLGGAHAVLPGADLAGGLDAPVLVLVASSADTLQQVEQALNVGN
jgi:beta-lactam-binding protein with PASTA domain